MYIYSDVQGHRRIRGFNPTKYPQVPHGTPFTHKLLPPHVGQQLQPGASVTLRWGFLQRGGFTMSDRYRGIPTEIILGLYWEPPKNTLESTI